MDYLEAELHDLANGDLDAGLTEEAEIQGMMNVGHGFWHCERCFATAFHGAEGAVASFRVTPAGLQGCPPEPLPAGSTAREMTTSLRPCTSLPGLHNFYFFIFRSPQMCAGLLYQVRDHHIVLTGDETSRVDHIPYWGRERLTSRSTPPITSRPRPPTAPETGMVIATALATPRLQLSGTAAWALSGGTPPSPPLRKYDSSDLRAFNKWQRKVRI